MYQTKKRFLHLQQINRNTFDDTTALCKVTAFLFKSIDACKVFFAVNFHFKFNNKLYQQIRFKPPSLLFLVFQLAQNFKNKLDVYIAKQPNVGCIVNLKHNKVTSKNQLKPLPNE